ncbi:hypothetical protein [Nostoc sp.]|uniref:hypothetical protein n=1 Tax=Nostoc sp. TaxID=1180 RepID=UPI002FF8F529
MNLIGSTVTVKEKLFERSDGESGDVDTVVRAGDNSIDTTSLKAFNPIAAFVSST